MVGDKCRRYATIEPVLTELAGRERERLNLLGMLPDGAPFIVYVPQLGFLIKVPLAGMAPEQAAEVAAAYSHVDVGLDYQFDADGEFYFKGGPCSWLDERYAHISSHTPHAPTPRATPAAAPHAA